MYKVKNIRKEKTLRLMLEDEKVMKLEREINHMKIKLNDLTVKGLDKNEIIDLSQRLDLLINQYYKLQLKD